MNFRDFFWDTSDLKFKEIWKKIFETKNKPTPLIFNQQIAQYLDSAGITGIRQVYRISCNIFVSSYFNKNIQETFDIKATINFQSNNYLTISCKKHEKTGSYPFFDTVYDFIFNACENKQSVAVNLDNSTRPLITAFLMRYCNLSFSEASRHLMVCLPNFYLTRQDIVQLKYYQEELSIKD